jgi:hypothetical protein
VGEGGEVGYGIVTPGTEPDEVKPPEVDVANNVDAPRRAT